MQLRVDSHFAKIITVDQDVEGFVDDQKVGGLMQHVNRFLTEILDQPPPRGHDHVVQGVRRKQYLVHGTVNNANDSPSKRGKFKRKKKIERQK